ncbi:MAG TPA: deoxyhypusine synthase family protein [Bryobacteraceae bacterium]|nr:deoxyhypusine synthase family protein [Bryobacteraceae bacterium]
MRPAAEYLRSLRDALPSTTAQHLDAAIDRIAEAKEKGRRVAVITGSGPNIHEGVTTLIAELIRKEVVDGVITSSAVIAHEMAGTLDRVWRVTADGSTRLPLPDAVLPRGRVFEVTQLEAAERAAVAKEMPHGWDLYDALRESPGQSVIKAAGNMAWPLGLRTERLAREIQSAASQYGVSLEHFAGFGADPMTMIGAAARRGVPVVVSIPQLIGGGAVGLAIGDTWTISRRARAVANVLAGADVIIESAIALTQEIHDGPFETYTGHGIWASWDGLPTYSLEGKTLVRIDLDPNLERAWQLERSGCEVQKAVNLGLPKTKTTGIPFRMEMSGFARLETSIPVTADIGAVWPLIAAGLEERLGIRLDFISAPQESEHGKQMRDWIASGVRFIDREGMFRQARHAL